MKLPDGPGTPPILQTIEAIAHPLERLEKCAQRYGDPFTSRVLGFPPIVTFSSPQAIQEIFTADPSLFDSGAGNRNIQFLLGDNSLILLDGERHQRQRRLLTPPFHGERMRTYGKLICNIAEQVISQWTIGNPFLVRASMQEISLRVILRVVFGIDEGERFQQLRQLLSSLLDSIGSPLGSSFIFMRLLRKDLGSWSPWGRFLRQKQQIDELLYAEIRQRRDEPNRSGEDILSLMMAARDEQGQAMTDVELRDELLTLLFAGHETTASALAWALYWIYQIPEVRDKLLEELDGFGDDADPSAFAKLPYLNAVCQETLRIYPVAMFTFVRILKQPLKIMGYEFDAKTVLAGCIFLTHQRPELYPEPKQFRPERFLERQFSPYEYLPFGGSNRRCIGMAFAQFEMKLVLATILSRFQLSLADRRPVKPVRRGITLSPPPDMRMVPTSQRQGAKIPVQL